MEEVADVADVVARMVQARSADTGDVAAHDEVTYCQKALLVHSHAF